ncbi:MAG: hypothetical protein ORN51_12060 [Akkermansiaceae bacterium]|nr:hypothetical protein [Akkermansiaceae bacterium]
MINQFQVHPLDIAPAIASLTLTKNETTAVSKACDKIRANLALEAQAHPDNLRTKLHEAELHFNDTGSEESLQAYQDAARALAGATEGFAGVQRSTAHRNEGVIDSLMPIALRAADELHAKIREAAGKVAEAENSAKTAFSNLDFSASFDDRLQRTFDLLAEDRMKIEQNHAALHFLVSWHLAENPYG